MQKRTSLLPIQYVPYKLDQASPIHDWGKSYYSVQTSLSKLHVHNCLELGFCHEGHGVFLVDKRVIPFQAGDISIIFKNIVHIARSEGKSKSLWKFAMLDEAALLCNFCDSHFLKLLTLEHNYSNFPWIIRQEEEAELHGLALLILQELAGKRKNYLLVVRGLMLALLALCFNLPDFTEPQARIAASHVERIAPALSFIAAHYSEEIYIEVLAAQCNMSTGNFRRVFEAATGEGPLDYLHKLRINMAAALLAKNEYKIIDIASRVGYDSLSSFNRQFKQLLTISPREYRQQL